MSDPRVPDATPSSTGPARQAIYRRWRAQRFGELIGQDPIVTTLRNAVAAGRTTHAYLFVGPRGTGKTSTARLLAKAVNCLAREPDGEPCDACAACVSIREGRALDVIEIDAASHGLVEDARELVMRSLTAPSELHRRVYIIDEVHMLSGHAFNALLKLIEEPPGHVVFILATTDTHKVPATIISRTQRFDFRRLTDAQIVGKLSRISASEAVTAAPGALELIARLAEGGMRDAESLLDQVLAYASDELTEEAVREAVGLADESTIAGLVDTLIDGQAGPALDLLERLGEAGRDFGQVAAQLADEVRRRLMRSASEPSLARELAAVLRALSDAAGPEAREGRARLALELLAVERSLAPSVSERAARTPAPAPAPPPAPVTRAARPHSSPAAAEPAPEPGAPPSAGEPESARASEGGSESPAVSAPAGGPEGPPALEAVRSRWTDVVERATPVLKPLLRECRPVALTGVRLTLAFPEGREFMRSRISARAEAIELLLASLFGERWAIECVATNVELEPLTVAEAVAADPDDPGGRALLEGVLKVTGGELIDVGDVR